MKILVTGSSGQLGKEIINMWKDVECFEVIGLSRNQLDVSIYSELMDVVKDVAPDVIINTAAFTDVDGCEQQYTESYRVNVVGPRNLAQICKILNIKLIHISTDYVFGGDKKSPYSEHDSTMPLSVYGKTKLAGEWEIRNNHTEYFIIRTSWLYGNYGNNFVSKIIELSQTRNELSIVSDQFGAPTYTVDLVRFIEKCLDSKSYGIYHFSNEGICSWYEFAKEIVKNRNIDITIKEVTTEEFGRLADRPRYSVLDSRKAKSEFDIEIRDWKESLIEYMSK